MPKNFKAAVRDPRFLVRAILGVLLAANLVAAVLAFKPFGGSADDLRQHQAALQNQLAQAQARLAVTRALSAKIQKGRAEGDQFLDRYVTDRRTTFSTIFG